jgi:polyhydroxyalkanoate synthesis regulator phasin
MAQSDLLKRYLDAGLAFTQMTQQRAEAIVKDLVKAGEVQAEQATARRNELVERSKQNTERLVETVRREVRDQIRSLGLATQSDIDALRREIASLKASSKSATSTSVPSKAAAPAKKVTAKKATAKKPTSKKA